MLVLISVGLPVFFWKSVCGVSCREKYLSNISLSEKDTVISLSISSFESKFWSGVRWVLVNLTSSDIPVWLRVWVNSCEHSGVTTVENVCLLVFLFGGLAIGALSLAIFIVFVSKVPGCYKEVGVPLLHSFWEVSLWFPDVSVTCLDPLDIINYCLCFAFLIKHACPIYFGAPARTLMVLYCFMYLN